MADTKRTNDSFPYVHMELRSLPECSPRVELTPPRSKAKGSRPSGTLHHGRYTLQSCIGHGPWGQVFEARDEQDGHQVAVKLTTYPVDERARDEFFREVKAMAQLRHRNIGRVHGCGVTSSDACYLVTELVRGQSLETLLSYQSPLGIARAISITLQVLEGLVEAHRHRVAHSALKPSNVLIKRADDQRDLVVLVDFLSGPPPSLGGLGLAPTLLGPDRRYAAPEQLTGGVVGPASAVCTVARLCLEMVLGTTTSTQLGGFRDAAPNPDCEQLRGGAGKALTRILDKALSVDPRRRYQSVIEMHEALLELCEHEAPNGWQRRSRTARRSGEMSTRSYAQPDNLAGARPSPQGPHTDVLYRPATSEPTEVEWTKSGRPLGPAASPALVGLTKVLRRPKRRKQKSGQGRRHQEPLGRRDQ